MNNRSLFFVSYYGFDPVGNVVINPNPNSITRTQLLAAAFQGNTQLVRELIPHVDVNKTDSLGYTALHLATSKGYLEIVNELIPVSDVNKTDSLGNTALHYAAINGNLEIVKALIHHHIDVNISNLSGITALKYAIRDGHLEIVKALIPHVDVNIRDHSGETALHYAASYDRLEIVEYLLPISMILSDVLGKTPFKYRPSVFPPNFGVYYKLRYLLVDRLHLMLANSNYRLLPTDLRRKLFEMLM